MTAPSTPGTYQGYWQMEHSGTDFGDRCWVLLEVVESGTPVFDPENIISVVKMKE